MMRSSCPSMATTEQEAQCQLAFRLHSAARCERRHRRPPSSSRRDKACAERHPRLRMFRLTSTLAAIKGQGKSAPITQDGSISPCPAVCRRSQKIGADYNDHPSSLSFLYPRQNASPLAAHASPGFFAIFYCNAINVKYQWSVIQADEKIALLLTFVNHRPLKSAFTVHFRPRPLSTNVHFRPQSIVY